MKTIHILAKGESVRHYDPTMGGLTVGINDVALQVPHRLDWVLTLDTPGRFHARNRQVIISSGKQFACVHQSLWRQWRSVEHHIKVGKRTSRPNLFEGYYPISITSPYVAAIFAVRHLQADAVVFWGVDMLTHPMGEGKKGETSYSDYFNLHQAFTRANIGLYRGIEFGAYNFLPVWSK